MEMESWNPVGVSVDHSVDRPVEFRLNSGCDPVGCPVDWQVRQVRQVVVFLPKAFLSSIVPGGTLLFPSLPIQASDFEEAHLHTLRTSPTLQPKRNRQPTAVAFRFQPELNRGSIGGKEVESTGRPRPGTCPACLLENRRCKAETPEPFWFAFSLS